MYIAHAIIHVRDAVPAVVVVVDVWVSVYAFVVVSCFYLSMR